MAIKNINKQPSENLDYDFDFANAFPAGDNVASEAVAVSPTGPTLGTKTRSGQVVKQYVSGGTTATTYKITCVATSVAGRVAELDFNLVVKEI